ncbi:MAG: 5-(carboxyamino)imidazole ribonucleotide mutase [Candidatus Omnitrophota bacterium]|jgi:5-(carboxyamino)imidazole ribonucleotide mutase|nr:MAG: 5-(carboxyamino)imidazole ribonucleotide mutase [Candidatus Omnitrophota bacterium]
MKVAVIMGSASDKEKMMGAVDALNEFGIECESKIMSAHRSPELVKDYVTSAPDRGIRVFICGAGYAAHLAGCVAGQTTLPVIGVPLSGSALSGQDSLYATVQMPKGVPVATVAIDGAYNAGLLAVQMLSLANAPLQEKLKAYRTRMAEEVAKKNQ